MVSKKKVKSEYSSPALEEQQESEEYLVKKQKGEGTKRGGPETSAPVPSGKEILKSCLVTKKARLSFEDEGGALHQMSEDGCKASQLTAESYDSQDLFITQKTFLSAESSSDESVSLVSLEPRDERCSGAHLQASQQLLAKPTADKATQTHDFFSSLALSTSFRFRKLYQKRACGEQALDLSLPKGLRGEPSSVPAALQFKQEPEEAGCEATLNPRLMSAVSNEQKSTLALAKAGVARLKGQTQLNESFFFRKKGAQEPPRPQSPLLDVGVTKSKMPQLKLTMKARRPYDLKSWSHSKH
ncbi:hypothetical protein AAFF_G00104380 [Aldrovandia affinis]|uniref:Uncharacterized protein n=1 Tax=Aldrovandia affinis TaxID=143900 RepID=A0AAD7WX48_9TELE|nr:hypothetical protein AAFF_G00104380 [Aldrovandia affinis]